MFTVDINVSVIERELLIVIPNNVMVNGASPVAFSPLVT